MYWNEVPMFNDSKGIAWMLYPDSGIPMDVSNL